MTEAKGGQRVADLFTKGSHLRNISVSYFTQNLFPQGKACRDIAHTTQYLVLFNNPIGRQQVPTLARRIYPSASASCMRRFEQTTSRLYGYLVVDLKASTSERDRLHTDIFKQTDERQKSPELRKEGIRVYSLTMKTMTDSIEIEITDALVRAKKNYLLTL